MNSSFQDDTREIMMRDLFELEEIEGRSSTDALLTLDDGKQIEFELKTTGASSRSVTTVRDFGPEHIKKWKKKHWLFGFYDKGQSIPSYYLYASPKMMDPWILEKWRYIKPDFDSAELVSQNLSVNDLHKIMRIKSCYSYEDAKRLHKKQLTKKEYLSLMDVDNGYSQERMLEIYKKRIRYLILRGSTLNNPKIPGSYFSGWNTKITDNFAKRLRNLAQMHC